MGDPVVICTKSLCDGWFEERVTFDVSEGRASLMRQERQLRSEMDPSLTTLNVWETDPEAGIGLPREALADLALALLPHLTGDELRRVEEAMPRVAGEWTTGGSGNIYRTYTDVAEGGPDLAARVGGVGVSHEAVTWIDGVRVRTTHPTARAAQAACDARLESAGVRLCGEWCGMADRDDNADAGHVSHDEADTILSRFNASHWGNPEEHARYSIPADPRRDDDIRLAAYIAAARETEADRDRLRALLATYGRAVEEEGKRLWVLENEDELVLVVADTKNEAEYEGESYTGNTFPRVRELSLGDGVVLHERKQP